jgi:quercetin dioxygenase-like cupin family protein
MYKAAAVGALSPGGDPFRVTWLADRDRGGSRAGALAVVDFEPGAVHAQHRHPGGEQALVVLTGEGNFLTPAGDQPAPTGAVLHAPAGAWHGFRAGDAPVRLLSVLGGVTAAGDAGEESAGDGGGLGGPTPTVLRGDEGETMELDDAALGFRQVRARWIVDSSLGGTAQIVVGRSEFAAAGGVHELHRHPDTAEFLMLLEGAGEHLNPDGTTTPVGPGEMTLIPAGEWHGFRNTGPVPVHSVFGYLGVNTFEDGGYELPDPVTAGGPGADR